MAPAADPLYDCAGWWDPADRSFASLRAVSAFRLALLDDWLGADWRERVVVDLGCGGGLLAVPLARRGARVLGVDVARTALQAARRQSAPTLIVAMGDVCAPPVGDASADVVLLADVVEHLPEPAAAVAAAARLLRPGGRLFVNTIARTLRSRLFAIWLAEGLGYVPRGTHRHDWFVRPDELVRMATSAGLREVARVGEAPRLLATVRTGAVQLRPSPSMAVGYAMLFAKEAA